MTREHDWIRQAAQWREQGRPFALVTVLRVQPPTSARPGDKALVDGDGQIVGWIGGGCAQPAVVRTVRQALADGQPRTIRIAPASENQERSLDDVLEFGMACHSGGTLELFIDPVRPEQRLVVLGDSPVARALADLAPRVGLRVAVVAQGAQDSDHPEAEVVLAEDEADLVAQRLGEGGFVVVATQGRRDLQGLRAALALRPQALWFVASARKAQVLRESLVAGGADPQAVAAIRAPAGEPIGAQTPQEVALSVLAAVVAARRGKVTVPAAAPIPEPAIEPLPVPASAAAGSCCGGAKKAKPAPLPELPAVPGGCCGG